MNNLSIQNLKSFFDFIESSSSLVLWIRSLDYRRQLYVSPSYEHIWNHKVDSLYENPPSWNDFLYLNDKNEISDLTKKRIKDSSQEDVEKILFRINDKEGNIQHIKDIPYQIVDENNNPLAFAGISERITESQWEHEFHKARLGEVSHAKQLKNHLVNIIRSELKLQLVPRSLDSQNRTVNQTLYYAKDTQCPLHFTDKEIICLEHLMAGKSAKVTAHIMNISPRTVEFHINNIKEKAGCRTKLEILGKVYTQSSAG